MKTRSNSATRVLALAGLAVFSTSPAWAVFPFSWATDGSGNTTDGSWTGVNGTVQPNLNPASKTSQIAVQGFTSGSFVINNLGGDIFETGRLLTNPISATHRITLNNGGTADLRLHNSTDFDGGGSLFNSVGLTNFNNVTSITWTIEFSEPLAGRNDLHNEPWYTDDRLDILPMGAGLALINEGSGQNLSSFTVGMDYTEIYHEMNGEFLAGVPDGALPIVNPGFGLQAPGSTSFISDAFNDLDEFLLVRGYDMDGGSAINPVFGIDDAPMVYMREMTWTITLDDNVNDNGLFASDTLFVVSMDGQQFDSVQQVPEPSGIILLSGSLLGACLLRRRRA